MSPFNEITEQFTSALSDWKILGIDIAKEVFVVLAMIQIIWCAALWMLNRDEPDSVLVDFIRKMVVLSIFWEILLHYDLWIPVLVNTFRDAGMKIAHTGNLSPGDIFEKGILLATIVYERSGGEGWVRSLFGTLSGVIVSTIIFLAFTRIAIEMILILIGSRIILVGGIIMLGFAGSQWTRKYAERYFITAITIGIKMLFITLIVGLGESLSNSWATILDTAPSDILMKTYFSVVGASLVYGYLAVRIPDMAASMLTGEPFILGFADAPGRAWVILRGNNHGGGQMPPSQDQHYPKPQDPIPSPMPYPMPAPYPQEKHKGEPTP